MERQLGFLNDDEEDDLNDARISLNEKENSIFSEKSYVNNNM